MLRVLDAAALRRWAAACVEALDADREDIDRINVYPVADGDTGTNLLHTLRAALDALLRVESGAEVGVAAAALARGALAGARGNSGVILSQVLRGFAEAFRDRPTADAAALRSAFARAADLAHAAVADPAPGTVLSVLRSVAEAVAETDAVPESGAAPGAGAEDAAGLAEVVVTAARTAAHALAETPRQLAALARAGVVDAGGRGLVVILDALVATVTGQAARADVPQHRVPRSAAVLHAERESGSTEFGYEVMYLLDRTDDARAACLRAELAELGDCVSVVSDGTPGGLGLWTVHVHTNDVGAAVEVGIEAGRPHRITVVRFADQVAAEPSRFARDRAVVVVADGAGAAELFRGEGAVVVVGRPGVAELLAAITGSRARHVVVVPNADELTPVAEQAADQAVRSGQDVIVVPTASPVQGLAALAVHDATRRPGDDVVAMAEAAAATRRGELVVAQREALTWVGRCQPGDVLGMAEGEVVFIAEPADLVGAACRLVDLMLSVGGELVTALVGAEAPGGLAAELEEHLRRTHPEVELTVYPGGQTEAILRLGVE
ncbi:hypothetical protein LX15_004645 [Streptoalloteichus tenebrarius]|uniref:DhaL domain-containing protein n=1 Tax=Streptoalloteichus tenebrarius (strain ATCC 17920 / DSM 40477 / JCM 4838 / CBS 697.72 / NBRC 16177 / NCIMB 11028 / NRRL B-12390 / A12253. 1 / ISP 5477) TaxID=1933 RepID=A0ABT1HZK4_STRSD|nr:DAK2 domain-containing protein [Streptoalloteichus tenebrarius]MCP2260925.1 hypothetical protein [Streptoalloteichus tenebrarius]BFF03313.1 DAK2 domain-containing protein [Streptoalloteichus tenebrarius]